MQDAGMKAKETSKVSKSGQSLPMLGEMTKAKKLSNQDLAEP